MIFPFSLSRILPLLLALSLMSGPAFSIDARTSLVTDCLQTLQKLFFPGRKRIIPADTLDSAPIQNFKDLQKSLSPYFRSGDPQGWNRELEKAASSTFLDGNGGGAVRFEFADGSRLIRKKFFIERSEIERAQKIVDQMKDWEQKGEGAALRGVSIAENPKMSEMTLEIVMEDLTAPQNSVGNTRVAGMGTQLYSLRKYSEGSRRWVANRMLELLDKHPDPHAKNVFYRVTKLSSSGKLPPEGSYYREGDLIFQVLLIDAAGEDGQPTHAIRAGDPKDVSPFLLQYNRQNQASYFKKQLNLPAD